MLNMSLALIPWCADDTTVYYVEPGGEEIPEDPQSAKEEREWCADDVE